MTIQTQKTTALSLKQSNPTKQKTPVDPALKQKIEQFQAVLLNQMVTAMEPKEGLFGKGFGGDFFQSLFRDEMSKELSKQMDFGMKDILARAQIQAQMELKGKK